MGVIGELTVGGRAITAAEIDMLDKVFRRDREMELVTARETHRQLRRDSDRLGRASMDGLGGVKYQLDPWMSAYLREVYGSRWFEDKTALRLIKQELPEIFCTPEGTRIQSGFRGSDRLPVTGGKVESRGPKFRKVYN